MICGGIQFVSGTIQRLTIKEDLNLSGLKRPFLLSYIFTSFRHNASVLIVLFLRSTIQALIINTVYSFYFKFTSLAQLPALCILFCLLSRV